MQLAINFDKRWEQGRQVWVRPPVVFDPSGYTVDVVDKKRARAFVEAHHYEHTFPSCRLGLGLFNAAQELVGVSVLSQPWDHVIKRWTGYEDRKAVAELGRFVCDPSVAFNGETWFIARAFRILREQLALEAVISYADPVERSTLAGDLVKPEHWGTIYQAGNALYVGRAEPRTLVLDPAGHVFNGRALTKIRKQERGARYAEQQLIDAGAPAREINEDARAWVTRALASFRRIRHPGNLTYLFGLTRGAMRQLRARNEIMAYEKKVAA